MGPPAAIRLLSPALAAPLLALGLAACGQRFSNANIDVINRELTRSNSALEKGLKDPGITPKLVESILGQPKTVETRKLSLETQKKEVDVVRYVYVQDGQTLELHFFDNKLISSIPHLGTETETSPIP